MRFFDGDYVRDRILQEYDGTNIKKLAFQYDYSEKTIRRILRDGGKLK
jgi:Mor family transcriptional regulator